MGFASRCFRASQFSLCQRLVFCYAPRFCVQQNESEKIQVLSSLSGGLRSSCYCCAVGRDQAGRSGNTLFIYYRTEGFPSINTFFYSLMFKLCSLAYQRQKIYFPTFVAVDILRIEFDFLTEGNFVSFSFLSSACTMYM